MEGFRSALNPVFKMAGEDHSNSPEIEMLFKSLRKTLDREEIKVPLWHLQSDKNASLTKSPMQTLFLISLARKKRVSEATAMNEKVRWG